ncbi:tyrosine-type recombinase/integrase [Methylophilus sp. QUAN]|uniref:Tyrosine-type recombinase/integrase n=2 Tax=Methylophilus TaxID=16 RepID=A0ABW3GLF1_9PROT|nr:site-specific integrase [Methylophilus sp. QUAN]
MIDKAKKIDIKSVIENDFNFDEEFYVSKKSKFQDDFWDFFDESLTRQTSVPISRLQINWENYRCHVSGDSNEARSIPDQLIYELKILTAISYLVDSSLKGKGWVKPQTVIVMVKILARFFSAVYKESLISLRSQSGSLSHISSITDIRLHDIAETLKSYSFKDGKALKKGLKDLTSPIVTRYLGKGVLWTNTDIEALAFKYETQRTDYNPVMPNDLFKFLSNRACGEVKGFLNWLNIEAADNGHAEIPKHKVLECSSGGNLVFEDYTNIRKIDREISAALSKKRHFGTIKLRAKFKEDHGILLSDVLDYIYKVQRAAYTIIGMYTGARYSDLTTFQVGCIKKHHGIYVLLGTLVKSQDDLSPEENDIWPAIPIMRDALRCLEEISRVTFNPYLISSRETVPIGVKPTPLSITGFVGSMNNYLREIDTTERWRSWVISSHQLRHSLANQLARADLGLMFIAHQLKHLYSALNAIPPSVTLMYGNIADISAQRARQTTNAYTEIASSLYDPDTPVAGGGAEEFKQRRRVYFQGMAAQGWSKEMLMAQLSKQGIPFASVGTGYCGGRRDRLLKDGTKETSPCIGSLQCNPGKCSQAIITSTHVPQWKRIYEQNIQMAHDDAFAHAKDVHLTAALEAKMVLESLGEKVENS